MDVYDFDRTLYRRDSALTFCLFCLRNEPKCLLFLPGFIWTALWWLLGRRSKEELKSAYYSFLRFVTDHENAVKRFWERERRHIRRELFPPSSAPLVISASPEFLLKPLVEDEWHWQLIATPTDPRTGKLLSANCRGQEKVRRFREKFPGETVETFYSDSKADMPLAQLAQRAFLVQGKRISNWKW